VTYFHLTLRGVIFFIATKRGAVSLKCLVDHFLFWTMHLLYVNEKPTPALISQCIGTQYSPTGFDILKRRNMWENIEYIYIE
jgi:hypothetical protein